MSSSAPTSKACEGGAEIVKLAPMRMADLVKQPAPPPLSAMKKTGYVPPHLRKTASFPETPVSIASIDTTSKDDFPTLGSTPKSTRSAPVSASWTQIRNRFHGAAAATGSETPPATPLTSVTAVTNPFAALDEDASTAATPKTATSFKQIIKDRVKREEAERRGMNQEEPTDPLYMTHEQLVRNGWAILSLPPLPSPYTHQERAAWFANYAARAVAKELARDKEFEALCEIYAPAGTVEPELRSSRLAVDLDTDQESVGYEEPEEDHMEEVEAF